MSRFSTKSAGLRGSGVIPDIDALGGATAQYVTVKGFTARHMLIAFAAGALFFNGVIASLIGGTGHWIANAAQRRLLDGAEAAGVDISGLSASDIAARLTYSSDDARMLVEAINKTDKRLLDVIVDWLKSIDFNERWDATQHLLALARQIAQSPMKNRIAEALFALDDATIAKLGGADAIADLLRRFAALSVSDRHNLSVANFPMRPVDEARAKIWDIINATSFPAVDLIGPLADLARSHSSRLAEIRRYVADGAPLPSCKPVACAPAPCLSVHYQGLSCPSGSYVSEGPAVCVRSPYAVNPGAAK